MIERLQPAAYTGVDIESGPSVDVVCDATELIDRFGPESFDIVISTELLEHVRTGATVIENMKTVLRPGGTMLITTRSRGFWLHGWPWDFWRYEPEDMRLIFADMEISALEPDLSQPGVFLMATNWPGSRFVDLTSIALFSIVTGRRQLDVTDRQVAVSKLRHRASLAYWRVRAVAGPRVRSLLQRTTSRHDDVGDSTKPLLDVEQVPELEHQQRPQPLALVGAAVEVRLAGTAPRDRGRKMPCRRRCSSESSRSASGRSSPRSQRASGNTKPRFGASRCAGRQQVRDRVAQ